MDTTNDQWLSRWVEQVDELLRHPLPSFPYRPLLTLLEDSFEAIPTWHEVTPDARVHMEMRDAPSGWPSEEVVSGWAELNWWDHPLTRWYLVSQSVQPQSTGRVPPGLLEATGWEFVESQLRPFGLEHQLAIPLPGSSAGKCSFLLAQGDADFADDQLALARAVQPLMLLLGRQTRAHGVLSFAQQRATEAWGLTGRETAVLRLLATGGSTRRIARQLGCSPRTVDKHLERVYRKLDVRDRMAAVRLALDCGFDTEAPFTGAEDCRLDEGALPGPDDRIAVVDGRLRSLTPELAV
jgi:DNA-binding CsgD family transcriptional regulator